MGVELNHTIVWCSDQKRSAAFIADILDRPAPVQFGHFTVVELDNGISLDFDTVSKPIAWQHYAFLVDDAGFDHGMERIRALGADYWADPARKHKGQINDTGSARYVYFTDPDGHLMELMTRPYSG